jgi:hypothetical protein
VRAKDVPFPVFTNIPEQVGRLLRLGSTPETFVVSPDGKLLKVWVGAFRADTASAVESYFETKLPGLTPDPTDTAAPASGK